MREEFAVKWDIDRKWVRDLVDLWRRDQFARALVGFEHEILRNFPVAVFLR